MPQKIYTKKVSSAVGIPSGAVQTILNELRLLRQEIMLLLPSENLEEYAHPDRIKNSYLKAVKKYSPLSS